MLTPVCLCYPVDSIYQYERSHTCFRGIQDLHIDNEVMSGKQNIINGFRKHFSNLAVPIFDPDFNYKSSDMKKLILHYQL